MVLVPLLVASLIPILDSAFAQESEQFINRKAEIWGLFYKFMTAAFTVGAVITGVMVFIMIHFNEKKVKQREVAR